MTLDDWIVRCQTCGRKALWFTVKYRTVTTPMGPATSKKKLCGRCNRAVQGLDEINRKINELK